MSNNDTDFIKFLTILLVVGLMAGFTGCDKSPGQYFQREQADEILGGKTVQASSQFSKKVLYLAMGVDWTKTKWGLSVETQGLCTASAISKRILLTAAHCVDGWGPEQVNAVLSLNPFKNGSLVESDWVKVEKIIVHEKYNKAATMNEDKNDFALIKLTEELPPERVSKLASHDQTQAEMEIISIGFGRTDAIKHESSQAKESMLNYVVKQIKNFSAKKQDLEIEQLDKTGICSGDSGSPGFIYDSKQKEFFILGVASYVYHTSNTLDAPNTAESCHGYGVYMNVLTQREWIAKNSQALN